MNFGASLVQRIEQAASQIQDSRDLSLEFTVEADCLVAIFFAVGFPVDFFLCAMCTYHLNIALPDVMNTGSPRGVRPYIERLAHDRPVVYQFNRFPSSLPELLEPLQN